MNTTITYAGRSHSIDWEQDTKAIAAATGLDKATISRLRKRYAPDSLAAQRVDPAQPVAGYSSLDAMLAAIADYAALRVDGAQEIADACGIDKSSASRWLRQGTAADTGRYPSPLMLERLVQWWAKAKTYEQPAQPAALRGITLHGSSGLTKAKAKSHRLTLSESLYTRIAAIARRQNVTPDAVAERVLGENLARYETATLP